MSGPRRTFIDIIEERFPALLERVKAVSVAKKANPAKGLRSRSQDWDGLIARWVEGLDLESNAAIALSGFGDGSHVEALMKALPSETCVFCVEEKVEDLVAAGANERVCRLLEDRRLFIGCGELDQECFESLSRFPLLEVRSASPVIFAPIFNSSPRYYSRYFTEFARAFDYWRKLFGTNVTASGKWQSNTLKNLPILAGAPDIAVLKGAFEGRTMILISAGPSLDESLEFVRENEDRCVIVAVNSSYRALRNAGIVPHFVLAADPYEYTAKGFDGVSCDGTILLCPYIVYSDVVRRFLGRIATWSGSNILANYARKKAGHSAGSHVVEMGTVSACAFDFAVLFGCTRLIFVGQDLAARTDGQLHASDSFYEEMGINSVDTGLCRQMPGNTLASVPVEEKLYVYLKVFETLAGAYSQKLELINTSRLGARVEGIPYIPIDKMMSEKVSVEEISIGTIRDRIVLSSLDTDWVEPFFARIEAFVQALCSLSLKGALRLEMSDEATPSKTDLGQVMEYRSRLLGYMEKEQELFEVIKDGALKYELVLYTRSKGDADGLDEIEAECNDLKEYFWAIAEGSFALLKSIEEARCKALVESNT